MLILLIYCAASGDIMDNDSEYIANDDNDNNKGSETGGDIVDNEYLANDEYCMWRAICRFQYSVSSVSAVGLMSLV